MKEGPRSFQALQMALRDQATTVEILLKQLTSAVPLCVFDVLSSAVLLSVSCVGSVRLAVL